MWVFSLICGLAVIWEILGGIYTCNEYKIELFMKNILQVKDEVVGYKFYKQGYKFDFQPPKGKHCVILDDILMISYAL